jgi:hypothetical protein
MARSAMEAHGIIVRQWENLKSASLISQLRYMEIITLLFATHNLIKFLMALSFNYFSLTR